MSTITVAQEIENARETLTPYFDALREDQTAMFWETFGAAAARYRSARSEGPAARDFAGIVSELIRDARGTALTFPREFPETDTREVPPMPSRKPWATMPTDGSGRMGPAERILYAVTGTLCVAVLIIVGFLVSGHAASPDAPATDGRTASQVVSDADKITQGGYWSWQAADACGRGHTECAAVLREVNMAASQYGLKVWEDGSISPVGN